MKNSAFLFFGVLILLGCPANTSLPEAKKDETTPVINQSINSGLPSAEPVNVNNTPPATNKIPVGTTTKDGDLNETLKKAGIVVGGVVTLGGLYLIHKSLRQQGDREIKAMFDKYGMEIPKPSKPVSPEQHAQELKRARQTFSDLEQTTGDLKRSTQELESDLDLMRAVNHLDGKGPTISVIEISLNQALIHKMILKDTQDRYIVNLQYFESIKRNQSQYNDAVTALNKTIDNLNAFVAQSLKEATEEQNLMNQILRGTGQKTLSLDEKKAAKRIVDAIKDAESAQLKIQTLKKIQKT